MSGMRVSDLHLKKELTQIRKASRSLRDPGTTSSWKSPLSSSRSVAVAAFKSFDSENGNNNVSIDSHFNNGNNNKEKKVFLYNWKTQKSSSEKSNALVRNCDIDDDSSCSVQESVDDSLSDARNGGVDSKSDTYLGEQSSSAALIFRCRDTNLVSPSMKRALGIKKKSKKTNSHFDSSWNCERKDLNLRMLSDGHRSKALGLGRDESAEQSDDTEDFSNSEDLRKISGESPLLMKLKHKNWSNSSSKLLRCSRKEDSSYCYSTPALSVSSYNRYYNRNPSTIGSWDATTTSLNDGDDDVDDQLDFPGSRGCGIPCYWSKRTPRQRGMCRGCYSPSFSDTLRRKGSSMLCGSQSIYHRRGRSLSVNHKRRLASRSSQGLLPLLTNSGDDRGLSIGTGRSDDELSTNFGELDLEALSRLDGRRWSNCRSQDGLEIVALNGDAEEDSTPDNIRSLSQKYRPVFFSEVVGQNIVVQSLINAVSRGRIAPVYLFQGPRGTGKTSTARIFASSLNCTSTEEAKPCGNCRECVDFVSGKTRYLWEVDGTNKKSIEKVRYLLKKISQVPPSGSLRYKVFLIDDCHLLPSKMWLAFLKFLERPPQRVVFIFITTDPDNVPRTVQSRCQKYLFNKIKDGDMVARLSKISAEESLDVELDALDLIALNADGSLREAETMLDQLSLLGKKITTSLVNELVGVVSEEKLLELLELAMSSDTAETVKRARDLMDSGVDPMVIMSQLASLIMDIIAGIHNVDDGKYSGESMSSRRSMNEVELEKLKHALKLLSESEKQLRMSSDRSTWFTATLLQLGSAPSPDLTLSSSSRRQSSRTTEDDPSSASRECNVYKPNLNGHYLPRRSSSPASVYKAITENANHQEEYGFSSKASQTQLMDTTSISQVDELVEKILFRYRNSDKLDKIWEKCIERCHSKTLRQLLHADGKLLSLSEVEGVLLVYVAFGDEVIKARVERFLSSITNSIEMVLRRTVDVRIVLLPDIENIVKQHGQKQTKTTSAIGQANDTDADDYSDANQKGSLDLSKGAGKHSKSSTLMDGSFQPAALSSQLLDEAKEQIPMQRIESIIREQRLETAWLQAAEKSTPGSLSRLKPEKNQVLPQEAIYQNSMHSISSNRLSSLQWEDDMNHELRMLKMQDGSLLHKDQIGKKADHYPTSPSSLHHPNVINSSIRESIGYESSSGNGGCSRLFCWKTNKAHRGKGKGTPVRSRRKSRRFSLFGKCGKHRKSESRISR